MRNMSFALTKDQILNQTKTVTRRLGWKFLKRGDLIQPVEKCMGLKKGEGVERIGGHIRITLMGRSVLGFINIGEVRREGFLDLNPLEFVAMFCRHMKCDPMDIVTRIEFEYTEGL